LSDPDVFIRTRPLTPEERRGLLAALRQAFGGITVLREDEVGPTIGEELRNAAIFGIVVGLVLQLVYITVRFKSVRYAVAADVALLHDMLVVIGVFALTRKEVNGSFVAVLLTILGYSINDKIVLFDRIRENLAQRTREAFDRLVNRTLVYGALTALLGAGYAGAVLVLGQLFGGVGGNPPSWAVAGATLAVAALFQPARRRTQAVVDRRFNRRKYDAAETIQAFSTRLRDQIDLDTLAAELLAVVDLTMEPTRVSLWLRPSAPGPSDTSRSEARPTTWAY